MICMYSALKYCVSLIISLEDQWIGLNDMTIDAVKKKDRKSVV